MKKKIIFPLLIVLLLSGCTRAQKEKSEVKESIELLDLPDSLFKYKVVTEFNGIGNDYDSNLQKVLLTPLNEHYREDITNKIMGNKQFYGAYFYSKQNKTSEYQSFVLYIDSDAMSSLVLVLLNNDGNIVNMQLTDGQCDLLNQTDDLEIIGCQSKRSIFNEAQLQVIGINSIEKDFGTHSVIERDSTTSIYNITKEGKFALNSRDSVRVVEK
ncbi:MAG: hypothetical protein ACJA2S_003458 [Cyclobacteriaceae bacterium]|jgi:hypothetical protein